MSGHTPGPWKFGIETATENGFQVVEEPFDYSGPGYYENPSIYGTDGTLVVGCDEYNVFNGAANARLIAAAPDLLEALKALTNSLDEHDLLHDAQRLAFGDSLAAIAKATGEKQ